jgi:murein DD-endopeptidase MepM/ murein hydrolase activator NlpD
MPVKRALSLITLLSLAAQPSLTWAEVSADAAPADPEGVVTENLEKTAPLVKGQVLELFKRKHNKRLGAQPFQDEADAKVFDTENKIDTLGKVIKAVERGQRQAKTERKPILDKRLGLESLLQTINTQIAANTVELARAQRSVQETNVAIINLSRNINGLEKKISTSRGTLSKYFQEMYVASDALYDDGNDVDLVRGLVLSRGSVSDLWTDLHFKGLLQEKGKRYVEEFRAAVAQSQADREQLRVRKQAKLDDQARMAELRKQLDVQRSYKEKILAITARQEGAVNRSIALRQNRVSNLKDRLADLMDEYVTSLQELQEKYQCGQTGTGAQDACASIGLYYSAEKRLREEGSVTVSPFAWPVDPSQGVSAYFRDPDYFRATGSQHDAVDIVTPQGAEVAAAADGYLLYAEYPAPGKYAYAVVKHADGWITVYGHLSEIYAKQFDFVKRGQAFAKSGGTPGTDGAGPVTTGAHLHFETYQRQEPVDPLRHLDLSSVPLDKLDGKYVYKYAQDMRLRYGPRANFAKVAKIENKSFFYIPGDTETERQRKLIELYAVPPFNNWELWSTTATKGNVDASLVMCIGMAETRLGKYVKSVNNVGNIGNNDRGDVVEFRDAKTGVQAIVNTLNNKYLSKYDTIDMLSRWGNEDDQIYASSSANWHDNMIKCLSALKGRFVEDDLAFRYQ